MKLFVQNDPEVCRVAERTVRLVVLTLTLKWEDMRLEGDGAAESRGKMVRRVRDCVSMNRQEVKKFYQKADDTEVMC